MFKRCILQLALWSTAIVFGIAAEQHSTTTSPAHRSLRLGKFSQSSALSSSEPLHMPQLYEFTDQSNEQVDKDTILLNPNYAFDLSSGGPGSRNSLPNHRVGCVIGNALGVSFFVMLSFLSVQSTEERKEDQTTGTCALHATVASSASDRLIARDALLDNAKLIAISSVLLEHLAIFTPGWNWRGSGTVATFTNFDMPIFCFISGLVSNKPFSWKSVRSLLIGVLAPYVLCTAFMWPCINLVTGHEWVDLQTWSSNALHGLRFPGVSWYLVALMCWRIGGWIIMPLRHSLRLTVAVCVMIIVRYHNVTFQRGLNPAAKLFPIFILGQTFPHNQIQARLSAYRPLTLFIGASYLTFCLITEAIWRDDYLMWHRHRSFTVEMPWFWVRTLANESYKLSKGLAILYFITPHQRSFLTTAGGYSLYPYLLHWDFVAQYPFRVITITGPQSLLWQFPLWAVAILYCIALSVILASRPVRFFLWVFVEPTWLKRFIPDGVWLSFLVTGEGNCVR